MNLIFKRILAFAIDYLILVMYGSLLFGITLLLSIKPLDPMTGQLIGFFTMTLPVFLYFYISENSKFRATLGKRLLKIQVVPKSTEIKSSVLKRNILKFLPWEIAHTGVHWAMYYAERTDVFPFWVWMLLIAPQLIVICYGVSIIAYKGRGSLYDHFANTQVIPNAAQ